MISRRGRDRRFGASLEPLLEVTLRAAGDCKCLLLGHLGITLNGGTVSAWADQSGVGDSNRNVTQGTAANQPTYVTADSAYNNRSTLSFDGTNDYLLSGTWSAALAVPATWYFVGHATDVATFRTFFDSKSGANRHILFTGSGNTSVSSGIQRNATGNATSPAVIGVVFNNASSGLYRSDSQTNILGAGDTGSLTQPSLTVGAWYTTLLYFHYGPIAAIAAYSGAHSSSTRQTIMKALGTYYGIAVT